MSDSQDDETNRLFRDSMMVATLAEWFDSTQSREFLREVILNVLSASLIQPTGSGKSLISSQQRKAVIVVPTISLMEHVEDHCHNLQNKGISAAYLGSDQPDKILQDKGFLESSP